MWNRADTEHAGSRSGRSALIALVAFCGLCGAAKGSDIANDVQAVAVTVKRTPIQSWAGYGIYLHDGLVLTAAHVAGQGFLTHPRVAVSGEALPTAIVKEGHYPEDDLTILRILPPVPPRLTGRRTVVCDAGPDAGQAVLVATPEAVTSSAVIAPEVLPPEYRTAYAASIKDVYTTGNSGSGVFDAASGCLLGIMSSKIEQHLPVIVDGHETTKTIGLAKHFVPAADIRAFLKGVTP